MVEKHVKITEITSSQEIVIKKRHGNDQKSSKIIETQLKTDNHD
jgi:hypothetical protein